MWTASFWRDTTERAVKTFAQSLTVILSAGALDVMSVGWSQAVSVAAGGALLSVLTSLASSKVGADESPSLVNR